MQTSLQLSSIEEKMFREIFQIFSKYKKGTRSFGVHLVHSHFPISEQEILYESNDKEKRILSISVHNINEFKSLPLATSWEFSQTGEAKVSMFCCDSDDGTYGDFPND